MKKQDFKHLSFRAGFGMNSKEFQIIDKIKTQNYVDQMIKTAQGKAEELWVVDDQKRERYKEAIASKDEDVRRRMLRRLNNESLNELRLKWFDKMVYGNDLLREKMAMFWHNHFATNERQSVVSQEKLLQIIRNNAVGSFGDLLHEISKSAVMIHFLNNQQNTKKSPNENFAREVMELFTLGRDQGYTEKDIKEAARAFTGWKADKLTGTYRFQKSGFDDGEKEIFGKKGNFTGEQVLDMLLARKETAVNISRKFYKYFVNPEVNESHVSKLADKFYKSKLDIAVLVKQTFTSKWFYEEQNLACLVKSPIELLVGVYRQLPHEKKELTPILAFSRSLDQIVFELPNVGGWPHHKSWIDSSSLLKRMQLPQAIISNEVVYLSERTNDDVTGGEMMTDKEEMSDRIKKRIQKDKMEPKVDELTSAVGNDLSSLSDFLLATPLKQETFKSIKSQDTLNLIKKILATPEYQLC
jgi:uncharacterized protein (DUF1800 family)